MVDGMAHIHADTGSSPVLATRKPKVIWILVCRQCRPW